MCGTTLTVSAPEDIHIDLLKLRMRWQEGIDITLTKHMSLAEVLELIAELQGYVDIETARVEKATHRPAHFWMASAYPDKCAVCGVGRVVGNHRDGAQQIEPAGTIHFLSSE